MSFNYQWTKLNNYLYSCTPLAARRKHAGVVYRNFLYTFGGCDFTKNLQLFERYDFYNQQWSTVYCKNHNMPSARFGHTLVVYGDIMIMFAG
jgi:N-acetylneuraminic acid mutarotase